MGAARAAGHILQASGGEVIHLDHNRSVDEIVKTD